MAPPLQAHHIYVALALLGAVALLTHWRPGIGLLAWMAALPVQLDTFSDLGLRLAPADIVMGGLLLASAPGMWSRRRQLLAQDPFARGCLLLLLWFAATSTGPLLSSSGLPRYALVNKLTGLAWLVLSYALVVHQTRASVPATRALTWYCALGSAWNLVGITAFVVPRHLPTLKAMILSPGLEDRVRGLLIDPNAYAGFLVSVLAVQVCILLSATGVRSRIGLLNALLLTAGLALADSRSGWLAGGCAIAVALWCARRRSEKGSTLMAATIGLAAPVLIWFLLGPTLRTSYEDGVRTGAVVARIDLVVAAVREFLAAPATGIGIGVFRTLPESHGYNLHTTYLWILAEAGILGLLLFVWVFLELGRRGQTALSAGSKDSGLVGLVTLATVGAWLGLMIGIEGLYQRHYWALAAIGAAWLAVLPRSREGHRA